MIVGTVIVPVDRCIMGGAVAIGEGTFIHRAVNLFFSKGTNHQHCHNKSLQNCKTYSYIELRFYYK